MSHKLIHLTLNGVVEPRKIAVRADKLVAVLDQETDTLLLFGSSDDADITVREPYSEVLRMWSEALSE